MAPLHNRRFALFVGLIYFLFAWVFTETDAGHQQLIASGHAAAAEATDAMRLSEQLSKEAAVLEQQAYLLEKSASADPVALKQAQARAQAARTVAEAADKYWRSVNIRWANLRRYSDANPDWKPPTLKPVPLSEALETTLDPQRLFMAAKLNPAFFFMLLGLWAGLVRYADVGSRFGRLSFVVKGALGTVHTAAHLAALLVVGHAPDFLFKETLPYTWATLPDSISRVVLFLGVLAEDEVVGMLVQVLTLVLVGGLLGAFIFGLYWALMSAVFARHKDDAFGALGLRHYKHFLRMKFERDRLTIYPIAVDTVPGRNGWKPACKEDGVLPINFSKIVPKKNLGPHLIEDPIVISLPRG